MVFEIVSYLVFIKYHLETFFDVRGPHSRLFARAFKIIAMFEY